MAKIEKPEAVDALDDILPTVDALMVARGDLGVEIPYQDVPLVQKDITTKALHAARPVVTATQMLRSMVEIPRPARPVDSAGGDRVVIVGGSPAAGPGHTDFLRVAAVP